MEKWKIALICIFVTIGLIVIIVPSVIYGISQPATTQPATTQPATTQPATTQPATTQPATTQPATTQPATEFPTLSPTTQPTITQTVELYTSAYPNKVSNTDPNTYQYGDPYLGALGARNETNSFCNKNKPVTCVDNPVAFLYYQNDIPISFPVNYGILSNAQVIGPNGKVISTNWTNFNSGIYQNPYLESDGSERLFRTSDIINNCQQWESIDSNEYSYSGKNLNDKTLTSCDQFIPYLCACNSSKTPS
jgi:hypothetical protein